MIKGGTGWEMETKYDREEREMSVIQAGIEQATTDRSIS